MVCRALSLRVIEPLPASLVKSVGSISVQARGSSLLLGSAGNGGSGGSGAAARYFDMKTEMRYKIRWPKGLDS